MWNRPARSCPLDQHRGEAHPPCERRLVFQADADEMDSVLGHLGGSADARRAGEGKERDPGDREQVESCASAIASVAIRQLLVTGGTRVLRYGHPCTSPAAPTS